MQNERGPRSTPLLIASLALLGYYAYSTWINPPRRPAPARVAEPTLEQQEAAREIERRDSPERRARQVTGTIRTGDMVAAIDNLGGGLTHVALTAERYRDAEADLDLVTTELEEFRPLRIDLPGVGIPADAVWELTQESPTSVLLHWTGRGVDVLRRIQAGDGPYQLWQTVTVRNIGARPRDVRLRVSTWHYVKREDEGGGMFGRRSPFLSQGSCRHDDETERKERGALTQRHGYRNPEFVALENVYFVQALAPASEPAELCGLAASDRGDARDPEGSLLEGTLLFPTVELAAGQHHEWRTLAYVGPKVPSALELAGHDLTDVVNLGTFASIARAFTSLLTWIEAYVGNWGVAIILLTLLVRLALFPLSERSFRSMAQIRKLKPEMDEINARFKDDFTQKSAATAELYRKHGITQAQQLSGCLPLVLQMPVFFALLASLSSNVELYHRPFVLWWQDLSAPDPYFVLPIAQAGLMWLQQKLTPTSMDPAQAKVMQFMPLVMGMFMLFMPSGLSLYMLTSSALGILQQRMNELRMRRHDAASTAGSTEISKAQKGSESGSIPPGKVGVVEHGSGRSRRG